MRFHVDADLGSEISLWIAPDHPDQVPRIGIWNAERCVVTMEANVLREDVRQLGMHSTGQVGFSITSEIVSDIERMIDLAVIVEADGTNDGAGLTIYRRSGAPMNRMQRLLIIDTASRPVNHAWDAALAGYAQVYPDLESFNLDTMLSVLGNELAPSIGAVGFPYLSRIRSILNSLEYRVALMFRDPMIEMARQIDRRISQDNPPPSKRGLIALLRDIPEIEAFDLSNPVMRRLLKAPGEQVSPKDVANALNQLAQLDFVATDQTRDLLVRHSENDLILLPPAASPNSRLHHIAMLLRQIGIGTDMIADDLTLYDLTSDAIVRACEKFSVRFDQRP